MNTNHKCKRSNVAVMDHKKQDLDTLVLTPMVNRMCLTCGKHWYGPEGQVAEFTRAQWDAWINSAFDEDFAAARAYRDGYIAGNENAPAHIRVDRFTA